MYKTFVTLIPPGWDFNKPHAGTCVIQGFCRGFEEIGLVSAVIRDTHIELFEFDDPIIMLGYDTFSRLSPAGRQAVSRYPHFIWVNMWADGIDKLAEEHNHPNPLLSDETYKHILNSGAKFLFCNSPKSYYGYYDNWLRHGQRLETILEACDTARYYPSHGSGFSDVEMALVNGYFSRKDARYQQYLWPYEDKLKIWGYNEWPKCYQGYLPIDDERILYQNAKVCPAIGEDMAETIGAFYERPFKVLGSGGLVITGVLPGYREVFGDDELLMPRTVGEYHDMVMLALHDEDFNREYRGAGYKAVMEKHTYAHRARQILELLDA